jgi:Fe-S oxidoreductase
LWPDTFNNHFHTDVGVACVEAIEAAGWQVVMPEGHVCCGRPLYDYGFLELAERYLKHTLDTVREEIRRGTPVVGMEPSCLAVFKDELTGMLPHDDDAERLARNAMHFAEFFERHQIPVPRLERKAIVWGHCHHKATGGMDHEHKLLKRMGVELEPVSGGCCGLAGSWGFEEGHHEISMQCGEQALLPAVRDAQPDTLVIADGFSCKTQIQQSGSERRALHVAQAIKMAREHGPQGYLAGRPEQPYYEVRPNASPKRRAVRISAAGALAAGAVALGYAAVRRR